MAAPYQSKDTKNVGNLGNLPNVVTGNTDIEIIYHGHSNKYTHNDVNNLWRQIGGSVEKESRDYILQEKVTI